ncbi:hypothetical protein FQZ97_956130 [compost metagenome]
MRCTANASATPSITATTAVALRHGWWRNSCKENVESSARMAFELTPKPLPGSDAGARWHGAQTPPFQARSIKRSLSPSHRPLARPLFSSR